MKKKTSSPVKQTNQPSSVYSAVVLLSYTPILNKSGSKDGFKLYLSKTIRCRPFISIRHFPPSSSEQFNFTSIWFISDASYNDNNIISNVVEIVFLFLSSPPLSLLTKTFRIRWLISYYRKFEARNIVI